MHVRPFFRHFSSFGTISWPIAGKLVFFLRRNKQYVNLGQHCWFFSLLFWHSESGFALPSCQKSRENKTANIARGAQLLFSSPVRQKKSTGSDGYLNKKNFLSSKPLTKLNHYIMKKNGACEFPSNFSF
jgi:hypothetical protein